MDVRATVRQLLLGQGIYSPMELLLATNRLRYEGYRAWRRGAFATLDEVLAERADDTQALLEEAEAWAQALELRDEPVFFYGWGEKAGAELTASRHPSLSALLSKQFRRIREQGQLDLFLDGPETMAVNALREALLARDADRARGELERLCSLHPVHARAEQATALIAALETSNPEGTVQGLEQLERLEEEWLAAASNWLGARSRDFLAPLWHGIGQALASKCFDPLHPKRHASWAYWQCLDWENLQRSVLAVPGYTAEPALLVRLAEAEWRLRNRPKAIEHWFALCWQAPGKFTHLVAAPSFPDASVGKAWRLMHTQDWEAEMSPAWFPAWMLIEEPGLARVLAPRGIEEGPPRAFDLVIALLAERGLGERSIALRQELQALHPGLLAHYLARFA